MSLCDGNGRLPHPHTTEALLSINNKPQRRPQQILKEEISSWVFKMDSNRPENLQKTVNETYPKLGPFFTSFSFPFAYAHADTFNPALGKLKVLFRLPISTTIGWVYFADESRAFNSIYPSGLA